MLSAGQVTCNVYFLFFLTNPSHHKTKLKGVIFNIIYSLKKHLNNTTNLQNAGNFCYLQMFHTFAFSLAA